MATWPGDRDRAGIHNPRLPLSSPTCGPPENHRALRDSDDGPGAGGAGAASRRAMQRPRFQVSRAAEDQILHCLSGLRANFAKFSFQKYPQRPAITRRGQSHTLTPWPVTQARLAQHVELTVTRVTRHARRQARLIRPGPSHSQRPAATRSGAPPPSAGRYGSHSPRPRRVYQIQYKNLDLKVYKQYNQRGLCVCPSAKCDVGHATK